MEKGNNSAYTLSAKGNPWAILCLRGHISAYRHAQWSRELTQAIYSWCVNIFCRVLFFNHQKLNLSACEREQLLNVKSLTRCLTSSKRTWASSSLREVSASFCLVVDSLFLRAYVSSASVARVTWSWISLSANDADSYNTEKPGEYIWLVPCTESLHLWGLITPTPSHRTVPL